MADEKVNMGPEENKLPETLSPPGQGDLPPLEENNAPAVSGEDKTAPDHVEPDPPSADKHTQRGFPGWAGKLHHQGNIRKLAWQGHDFYADRGPLPWAVGKLQPEHPAAGPGVDDPQRAGYHAGR